MIRLRRVSEPEALRRQRAFRLAEALLWPPPEGRPNTEVGYGDEPIRKALAEDTQHGLCAYCGSPIDCAGSPIDHFRPRTLYWWLTWSWENLWVTCDVCQIKGGTFDLEDDAMRLPPPTLADHEPAFELWRERPLLLDPAVDDPTEHLCVEPDHDGRWWWAAVPGSRRGLYTWERLRLGRFDADSDRAFKRSCTYERLNEHLERRVLPRCEELLAAIAAGDARARGIWDTLCRSFLYRKAEHLVPTWWYLDQIHRAHSLSSFGLEMPSHPDDASAEAAQPRASAPWPGDLASPLCDARTKWLMLHVRHNKSASRERVSEAVVAACAQGPQTEAELGVLLDRGAGTIRGYATALCGSGQIERIEGPGPSRYRKPGPMGTATS